MSKGKLTPDSMMSASRLAGLMGFSKYSTPNDELMFSIRALDGVEPQPFESEPADWGNRFESAILEKSCERLGLDTYNLDHTEPLFHEDVPLCCSLDGTADGRGKVVVTDPDAGIFVIGQDQIALDGIGVLEAKLTSQDAEDAPPLWRGPIQLQGQMLVTGAKWGAVCTLYRGTKLRIFLFARHDGTIKAIEHACVEFQKKLDEYKATQVVNHYPPQDTADANRLYPFGVDRDPIHLSSQCEELCQKILNAKVEIEELQALINSYEATLKEILADNTKGIAGKYTVSWPMRHYKAQPERVVPATEARSVRQSTLTIKESK